MQNIKLRWFKSVDDDSFVLQYCYQFRHEDGTTDWTNWETIPYVLG
jgi:hypothetical protein